MLEIPWNFQGPKRELEKMKAETCGEMWQASLASGHLCREGHQPQEITTSARLHTDVRQAWVAWSHPVDVNGCF